MKPPDSFSLPHGASGLEVGDFVVEFRRDKIVALAKTRDDHYTLHFGHVSGILDVHRTWKSPAGGEHHQTMFAMRHADIPAFLNALVPMTGGMFRLFRKLRIGWMHRHGIRIVRGLETLTDDEMHAVTRKKPGRNRIMFDEQKLIANMHVPGYLEDVWDFPDGAFSLLSGENRIGIGFKTTDQDGVAHLYWFKLRDVTRYFNSFEKQLIQAAARFAIPREEYAQHRVLEP